MEQQKKQKRLGINVDHVATLRQARGTNYPCPVEAAKIAMASGADGITIHLREDRRHIQDADVKNIREQVKGHLNFEMALTEEMILIALNTQPEYVCLVPEKREELTTEGGLNLLSIEDNLKTASKRFSEKNIALSLFIEADIKQIDMAKKVGANAIELHTGRYAELAGTEQSEELEKIKKHATYAHSLGLIVNAGHGLHYKNVQEIVAIPEINELNIGHSIVAQAVFDGLAKAVFDMKKLM